jgi:hypothetical protein
METENSFLVSNSLVNSHLSGLLEELSDNRIRRRSAASGCSGGTGNLGFNSFNFMTFVVLVFNAVANVNNNLNNNNNNDNSNNVNAVSQESNNVASTVNVANQIGITILPIPGRKKRSMASWIRAKLNCPDGTDPMDFLASYLHEAMAAVQGGIHQN